MDRAYALLNVKGIVEKSDEWVIEGIASTPTTDRMGDIVEPLGAKFKLPMPLLWQHNSSQPVGRVEFARPTAKGIPYVAHLPKVAEAGTLKDRIDEAVQSVKYRLIAAVSIGFRGVEGMVERTKDGGLRFKEWEWLELSLVTIPANAEATITSIKSLDSAQRAATGQTTQGNTPGDTGTKRPGNGFSVSRSQKGLTVKTLQELRETRTTKAARLQELVDLFKTDGHEVTDDETSEFDGLTAEVKELDQDIRISGFHAMQGAASKAVDGSSQKAGSASRGGISFVKKQDPDDTYAGESFTRTMIARALAMTSGQSAAAIAQQRWGKSNPKLVEVVRAAVAGGGTGSGEWGAELAASDARFTGDFIEYLYGRTVFDLLNLRSVPARVHVRGQDGAFTGYWVGESKGIPTSKGDYSDVELLPYKVAGLAVISMELLEDSSPSAEMLVRDGLVEASSQRVDQTFLSATAASNGVSPAGILNGVTAIVPSGTDLAAVRADLQSLLYPFVSNKMASGITIVMNPATAMAIGMMYGALDQLAYPSINQNGGTLNGMPVVVGDNVTPGDIIAIRTQDVWRIGDSGIRVTMSREATIEQSDGPTGATDTPVGATTTYLTNMFQEESIAFKVVRRINYQKRRSTAVQVISNAEYGGVAS